MPRKPTEEVLKKLIQKQEALKNRIASLEARKRNEEDKKLTRKKILIGAYILEKCKDVPGEMDRILKGLEKFLTRDSDRKLFNLHIKDK